MRTDIVRPTVDPDAVLQRGDLLRGSGLNGLRLGLVAIGPPVPSNVAQLEVFFFNSLHIPDILAAATAGPGAAAGVFRITGGHRLPAGPGSGQVQCTSVVAGTTDPGGNLISLLLSLAPIGDYSTYMLELNFDPNQIDPFFAQLPFKFRPGCFTNDCSPPWEPGRPRQASPVIDYLAKDYDSFRHTLIAAMMERVPHWQVTSEADLDQVLIDLYAARADELSDFQDRTMNEAYLATARNRVSIARHARLVDYHIHQGNQASTWLVVMVNGATPRFPIDEELVVWAGHPDAPTGWIYFATRELHVPAPSPTLLDPLLNEFHLHTWSDAQPALPAGSTSADIVSTLPGAGQPGAQSVRDLINSGRLRNLILEEKLNPLTGRQAGRNPRKRQLLRLIGGAQALRDPLTGTWMTRVNWQPADALRFDYCFTTNCPTGRVVGVSAFHGNGVRVHQGLPVVAQFHEPDLELPVDSDRVKHRHFERWVLGGRQRGVRCVLPLVPLAYLPTAPGGEVAPQSTIDVTVEFGPDVSPWEERISLVHSDDSTEHGNHFVVETDELGRSTLRFGDGVNGSWLPQDAVVHCHYQVGGGVLGNVGPDMLTHVRPLSLHPGAIVAAWNPFDVTDGRDPEPVEQILRNAPEAYRARQLRAITIGDYVRRAEEVPGVARAVARYAWTGSWRTVRIVLDPAGTTVLDPALRQAVAEHLEAVRLIGEDLEIRPPRFVPVSIEIELCADPDYWPQDLRLVLDQEFSDSWTPDGRRGFFHPDEWTFGQALHASQIEGRAQAVTGVEHIVSVRMRRFDAATPGDWSSSVLEVAVDEIILVQNDPDHMERGSIHFDLQGGRR